MEWLIVLVLLKLLWFFVLLFCCFLILVWVVGFVGEDFLFVVDVVEDGVLECFILCEIENVCYEWIDDLCVLIEFFF